MSSEILWVETSLLPLVKPLADRGQGHHGPVGWALQIIQQDPRNLTKRSFKKRVFCQNDLRIYPGKCICWLATLLSAPMNSAEREAVSFESDNDTQYTRVVLLPRWTAETGMTFDTTQWALIPFQKNEAFLLQYIFFVFCGRRRKLFGGKRQKALMNELVTRRDCFFGRWLEESDYYSMAKWSHDIQLPVIIDLHSHLHNM